MKKLIVITILSLTVMFASLPLLHPDLFRTHDYVHGVRIAEMTQALSDGHFPVRWTKNFGYGYGMPLFEFYAPLPYYVGSAWYWLTGDLLNASKLLWLIPNIFSTIGAYLLGRKLYGRRGGIITAVAFTLAPYRAVNMFVRGAVGESWGMMFFPWIFLGVLDYVEKIKNRWQLLTFSLAGLILSHNLMALLFFPVSLLFGCVMLISQKKNLTKLLWQGFQLLSVFVCSVGLTTFYWLPALVEKGFTQVESRILSGYFHYSQHFLYIRQFFKENWKYGGSFFGPFDDISFFLGYGQLFLFIIFAVLTFISLVKVFQKNKKSSIFNFKFSILNLFHIFSSHVRSQMLIVLLFSLLMFPITLFFTLFKSNLFWQAIPFLQTLQFPWRFLSLSSFFLAVILGVIPYMTRNSFVRVAVAFLILAMFIKAHQYFQPEIFLSSPNPYYYDEPQRVREQMSDILPDYIPASMPDKIKPATFSVWSENEGTENLSIEVDRTHEILVKTNFTQQELMQFAVASYPGWTSFVDGQKVENSVSSLGNLQVLVPAGSHMVGVQFQGTMVRNVADLISLLSLFGVVLFLLKVRKMEN